MQFFARVAGACVGFSGKRLIGLQVQCTLWWNGWGYRAPSGSRWRPYSWGDPGLKPWATSPTPIREAVERGSITHPSPSARRMGHPRGWGERNKANTEILTLPHPSQQAGRGPRLPTPASKLAGDPGFESE